MKFAPAALIALLLATGSAQAFSVDISLPNLTFPDSNVTAATKGHAVGQATVLAPKNG